MYYTSKNAYYDRRAQDAEIFSVVDAVMVLGFTLGAAVIVFGLFTDPHLPRLPNEIYESPSATEAVGHYRQNSHEIGFRISK